MHVYLITVTMWLFLSATAPSENRIVHFPSDRSVGRLFVQDATRVRQITDFFHWGDPTEWVYLCEAKGDVHVPAGKRLSLTVNQTAWKDLSWISNLGPDDLYKFGFTPSSGSAEQTFRLPDGHVEHIAHLNGLKSLSLTWTVISDKGMENLRQLKSLEYLDPPSGLTDGELALITEIPTLKGLYFLGMRTNGISNASLRHLSKLVSLEELYIGGDYIGDAGLVHLRALPRLKYLVLCGSKFTDNGLVHLKDIPSLKVLSLMEGLCQVTDAGLIHISNMLNLENLYLDVKGPITDDGLAHLSKMLSLKKLHFGRAQVTDKGLEYLSRIKTLERLDLPQEQKGITDKGMTYLGQLTNLKHLSISRIHFNDPKMNKDYYTDKGLEALVNCRDIENLSIGSIGVTDAGMDHIAKLTSLKWLHLFGCDNVSDKGLAKLAGLKSLTSLQVAHADITTAGLNQLNSLSNVTILRVHDLRRGGAVLNLSGLVNLEDLMLTFAPRSGEVFTDADLVCLADLKRLKMLHIGPRDFTDKGVAYLAGLTNIDRLGIGGSGLTNQGLKYLTNMKKLDLLTISNGSWDKSKNVFGSGGKFNDEGLRYLEGLKLLSFLEITSDNTFSAAAIEHLRQELPNLYSLTVNGKRILPGGTPASVPRTTKPTGPTTQSRANR